ELPVAVLVVEDRGRDGVGRHGGRRRAPWRGGTAAPAAARKAQGQREWRGPDEGLRRHFQPKILSQLVRRLFRLRLAFAYRFLDLDSEAAKVAVAERRPQAEGAHDQLAADDQRLDRSRQPDLVLELLELGAKGERLNLDGEPERDLYAG